LCWSHSSAARYARPGNARRTAKPGVAHNARNNARINLRVIRDRFRGVKVSKLRVGCVNSVPPSDP
jgi:hypothetical protein